VLNHSMAPQNLRPLHALRSFLTPDFSLAEKRNELHFGCRLNRMQVAGLLYGGGGKVGVASGEKERMSAHPLDEAGLQPQPRPSRPGVFKSVEEC